MDRLNATDEMLCGAAANLGSSRIVQLLWRFSEPVSSSALRHEWDRLNHGRLSRRVARAAVPGARRGWVAAHNEEPLYEHAETLTDETVLDWIDAQVRAPLAVDSRALWRLAAARYRLGAVVSLTVPHFRSDGLGVFAALGADAVPSQVSSAGIIGGDLGDALTQAGRAIAGTVRVLADRQARARVRAALRAGVPVAAGSTPRFFVSTIVELDAASWRDRAEAHDGTQNSLLVEIAANLVRRRIPLAGRDSIQVGIPKSLRRSAADGRANALIVVPLSVPAGEAQHRDLQRTRHATKTALVDCDERAATLVPEPVWQLLPRRLATRLKAPGAQQTDVVASNFGRVPDAVVRFAGQRAEGVALRTMNVPGIVPEKARLRASLCLSQVGDRLTLTATGIPDQFGDAVHFGGLVMDELSAWGLAAKPWCVVQNAD